MQYVHATAETVLEKCKQAHWTQDLKPIIEALAIAEKNSPTTAQIGRDTASILLDLGFGPKTTTASILSGVTADAIPSTNLFDSEVSQLVQNSQKLEAIKRKNIASVKPEKLQKVLLAIAKDARSLLIDAAKKTAELRFLSEQPKDQQTSLAENALQVWVPICHKLGLHKIRWELEDLAMKKLEPDEYKKIKTLVNDQRNQRHQKMESLVAKIRETLAQKNLHAAVYGRVKNFYRISRKMEQTKRKFDEIHDLIGARVICQTPNECYEALAILQNELKTETHGYDDYIAKPKKTGYQSIHINLHWKNIPAEIQIRTWDMHKEAEDGLACHWEYKQYQKNPHFDPDLSLAKQFTEWFHENPSIMESLHLKFEKNKIFVFTPKNDLIELPSQATPIDFAFAVHSDLGSKIEKAKANGKIVPLNHSLENGDTIEIITSEKQTPKQNWLLFVKSDKAKQKIRSYLQIKPKTRETKKTTPDKKPLQKLMKNAELVPAKCCSPLPGDNIVGYKTTKRKIKIHRSDCPNAKKIPQTQLFQISSDQFKQKEFETSLRVWVHNKTGILGKILDAIAQGHAKILSTEATVQASQFNCRFRIKTKSLKDLDKIAERIRQIQGVERVERN